MKNNGLKNAKAITLIAMVVTIIVLLILAGVSIAVLTGQNGILNRTTEAKTTSKIAEVEEEARLIYTDYLIGNRAHGTALADLETIYNYDKKNFTMKEDTQGTETVNGIKTKINETEIDLTSETPSTDTFTFTSDDTSTKTITISKDSTSSNGKKYYAVIEGKDYEMSITNGVVYVSRTPTTGGSGGATLTNVTATANPTTGVVNVSTSGNVVSITRDTNATSGSATITITGTIGETTYTKVAKVSIKSYASNTSKVGYYADLDGDGTITLENDGIIFADLAVGNQNTSGSNGKGSGLGFEYSIPTVSTGLKQYETATDSQNREYLKAATAGTDRFYVVALSNAGNSSMTWYSNAYGHMTASDTSTDFGTGKTNSETILKKGVAGNTDYGQLGSGDMWYLFTGDLNNWTADMKSWWASSGYQATKDHSDAGWTDLLKKGWFVPSKGEFAAMKGELSSTARSSAGLTSNYWSSSQYNANDVWYAYLDYNNFIGYGGVNGNGNVRLATTF